MRSLTRDRFGVVTLLLSCCLLAAGGCDSQVAGELVAATGSYLGDVVSTVTTGYLQAVWALEASDAEHAHEDASEHEHSHEATPLHDHEH